MSKITELFEIPILRIIKTDNNEIVNSSDERPELILSSKTILIKS